MHEGYTPDPEVVKVIKKLPGYYGHDGSPDRGEQDAGEEEPGSTGLGYQHGAHDEYFCLLNLHQVNTDSLSNNVFFFLSENAMEMA